MQKSFSAKACAKIIIAGEHAVVYGKPAVIAPIKLFATCTITPIEGDIIQISSSILPQPMTFGLGEVFPNNNTDSLHMDDKLKLIVYALRSVTEHFKVRPKNGFVLMINSEIPVGGFGSSTAVCTAIVKAYAKFLDLNPSLDDIFNLVMEIEEKFQGYWPSGADQAAIVYEKFIKFQKGNAGNSVEILNDLSQDILANCLVIQSGRPIMKTGDVVLAVKSAFKQDHDKCSSIIDRIEKLTLEVLDDLKSNNAENFKLNTSKLNSELIELGVVTKDTQELIRKITSNGGTYVKISGAGGMGEGPSGAMLCYCDEVEKAADLLRKEGIDFFTPW